MKTNLLAIILILISSISIFAAHSDFDKTFSNDGKLTTTMGLGAAEIQKISVQADGKIVAAGYGQNTGSSFRQFALARYTADGQLDTNFGNGGRVFTTISVGNAYINDLVLQNDGKIVAVGLLDTGSRFTSVIVRYNSNGSLDSSFSGDGILTYNYDSTSSDYGLSVVLQPDGKILVGSYSIIQIGNAPVLSFFISRFTSNGNFDSTFNNTGKTIGEFGNLTSGFVKIGLQPDGKIVAAGAGGNGSNIDFAAIRFNSNGSFDSTFANAGRLYTNLSGNDVPRALTILPDGKFIIAGYTSPAGNTSLMLVRYTANGQPDTSFGFLGFVSQNLSELNDAIESVAVQHDGKIVAAGRTGFNVSNNDIFVIRYRANGTTDSNFGTNGVKIFALGNGDDIANSIVIQSNGRITLGGSSDQAGGLSFAVARLLGRGTTGDFDGDGKSDKAVFRPLDGTWYIDRTSLSYAEYPFGNSTDKTISGDFDGDGENDVVIFRPSNNRWYILQSRDGFTSLQFGSSGDIPTPADYDGDGKTDIAVFRPSLGSWFYLKSGSGNTFSSVQFGANGDRPVIGDFDRDGKADFAVFRPSNGSWYILGSQRGFFAAQFGLPNDLPISADFDGDLANDISVYRPSNGSWYILRSSDGVFQSVTFGNSTDIPQAADFDGDGRADIGVFRPSTGNWFNLNSFDNSFASANWGINGDFPLASVNVQ